jgi:hypothetical protein
MTFRRTGSFRDSPAVCWRRMAFASFAGLLFSFAACDPDDNRDDLGEDLRRSGR